MGERDKCGGREFGLSPIDQAAAERERERKLRMLRRLSEVLGRPIEDFFETSSERPPAADEADGGDQG